MERKRKEIGLLVLNQILDYSSDHGYIDIRYNGQNNHCGFHFTAIYIDQSITTIDYCP